MSDEYIGHSSLTWDEASECTLTSPTAISDGNVDKLALDVNLTVDKTSDGGSSSYYELPEGATELDDLLVTMDWHQANIFKAAYRWGKKPDLEYNLNKIIWFAEKALERLKERSDESDRPSND